MGPAGCCSSVRVSPGAISWVLTFLILLYLIAIIEAFVDLTRQSDYREGSAQGGGKKILRASLSLTLYRPGHLVLAASHAPPPSPAKDRSHVSMMAWPNHALSKSLTLMPRHSSFVGRCSRATGLPWQGGQSPDRHVTEVRRGRGQGRCILTLRREDRRRHHRWLRREGVISRGVRCWRERLGWGAARGRWWTSVMAASADILHLVVVPFVVVIVVVIVVVVVQTVRRLACNLPSGHTRPVISKSLLIAGECSIKRFGW